MASLPRTITVQLAPAETAQLTPVEAAAVMRTISDEQVHVEIIAAARQTILDWQDQQLSNAEEAIAQKEPW